MIFKKTKAGNYFGYYKGYYVSTFRRPHGSWSCWIGKKGKWLYYEGYFNTSLTTLEKVKDWVEGKIK